MTYGVRDSGRPFASAAVAAAARKSERSSSTPLLVKGGATWPEQHFAVVSGQSAAVPCRERCRLLVHRRGQGVRRRWGAKVVGRLRRFGGGFTPAMAALRRGMCCTGPVHDGEERSFFVPGTARCWRLGNARPVPRCMRAAQGGERAAPATWARLCANEGHFQSSFFI